MSDTLATLDAKDSARREMSSVLISALEAIHMALIQPGGASRADIAKATERLCATAHKHWLQNGEVNANAREFREAVENLGTVAKYRILTYE